MTEFIKVDEEYISSVVSNAAWDAAGVSLEEKRGGKKGDKPSQEDEGDAPDFTTDARKGDKSKTKKGKKDFEREDSSVEVHECPLCESVLEEALSDEVIYEHVSQIQEALHSIEEKKKTEMKEQDDEDTPDDEPDDIEEEAPRKAKLLKKIAAMKGSASN